MQKNPIVPFILIMAFGIGLIFFLSMTGVDKKEEIAAGHEEGTGGETAEGAEFDPEVAQGKCITCHGGDLAGQGDVPALVGTDLSKEELVKIITNGIEGTIMPGGLLPGQEEAMADYILTLK
ncbi:c-type cytochrome [Paenisporosarcina indica]|uniref:c-type cytochrome n=1 Tax=Paenisporosarcina indica TaxID=650093 RepID=UPI00094F822A|nr:cytochrome c [Paenisporosarcina indica]